VSATLTALRRARGWTKAELARRAGLNAATIGWIESGRFRPYAAQIDKLAAALNVDAALIAALALPATAEQEQR
jgi:transcriptional regulator with XRE-family HTH domain